VPFSTVRRLLARRPQARAARAAPAYHPRLEPLEDRLLLSHAGADPFPNENESPDEQTTDGLRVVTYNVDPGSRLAPLLAAASPQALPAAMSQVWAEVQASDVGGRAWALAGQIAAAGPDVVGIQDAAVWTVNGAPRYDCLQLLQHDLRLRGQRYLVAAREAVNVVQLPDAAGDRIGLAAQTVILVDRGIADRNFVVRGRVGGTFAARRQVALGGPGGPAIAAPGTWACATLVNTENSAHTIRFVTAQLDPLDPGVNAAQGAELLAGPARTSLPVVLTGDFGLPAGAGAYPEILHSGFNDTWLRMHPADPGLTSREPDLRDPGRALQARTDLVFLKTNEDMSDTNTALLGTASGERTAAGLWASDHAGVLASLVMP
jgi:hypothetical protein